ncbi:MAG TPA: thiamine pyrophosphate-requiring protein [Candidatus Limnocylindria bacterium]|nr:thiamine pyrophosphate-requiring protein [Candidatus Limnocylindria bacterium]
MSTSTPTSTLAIETVAEAYLALLKSRGIDYLYVNAGTDSVSLVEAFARLNESGLEFPVPIVAVHENLAVGMAHGYYMVSRRPQAVMLHVSVGAANGLCALMNAARSQTPMLFTAGRTPLFEEGRFGCRSGDIHWAQELFDQGGMARELVKWDYELRDGANVEQVVDRADAIMRSEPTGPVYLTLPREVLAQRLDGFTMRTSPPSAPQPPHPAPDDVARIAEALANAEFPLIVTSASGADPATVPLLTRLCERFGIAHAGRNPRYVNFPTTHPLHLGNAIETLLPHADAILFLECDVPWLPRTGGPKSGAFVAQAGTDPLFARYPMRSFPADLVVTTRVAPLLTELERALEAAGAASGGAQRSARFAPHHAAARDAVSQRIAADLARGGPITKTFLTHCLDRLRPEGALLVNEYSTVVDLMTFEEAGTFFHNPPAGGLGWGVPAALGAQQAAPDRVVIVTVGDGSYLFANPAACHQAAAMHGLPVLTIVFNNARWEAVQMSTRGLYPDTHAARRATVPLASLAPSPKFEQYAQASDGYGERVSEREELAPALERALHAVRVERRHALLNVIGA